MTTSLQSFTMKIPGKIVINGSYIVLLDEIATVVTLDKYLNTTITYEHSDTFNIFLDIKNNEKFSFLHSDPNYWLHELVSTTLKFLETQNISIKITGYFDDGFFLENNVKTGLGSSSCLTICVVYSLFRILKLKNVLTEMPSNDAKKFSKFLYTVNKMVSPKSSGCDVMTSCLGPINYTREKTIPLKIDNFNIILGTFGRATSTRKMLDLIPKINWDKLKVINKQITEKPIILSYTERIKCLYREYLEEMRSLSHDIVPDKQYEILNNTFNYDIFGCGISGAGGEDAVWCITKDIETVKEYWERKFPYVMTCKLTDHGMIIKD
ncbi:mevalonate kinase [Vairimorpha necatrix]|uniref:phosphomevalonate kinase n=1 Tax=Vairimorpha necatrix TaxID=6039 RepID=A0AAX4J9W4_9MICR